MDSTEFKVGKPTCCDKREDCAHAEVRQLLSKKARKRKKALKRMGNFIIIGNQNTPPDAVTEDKIGGVNKPPDCELILCGCGKVASPINPDYSPVVVGTAVMGFRTASGLHILSNLEDGVKLSTKRYHQIPPSS